MRNNVYHNEISKMNIPNLDKLCLNIILNSNYPISTSLYLAAFMKHRSKNDLSRENEFEELMEKYVDIAKDLLSDIESDHLLAILLEIPSDINNMSILDISLRFKIRASIISGFRPSENIFTSFISPLWASI